jgi:regulatory factor X
LNPASFGKLVRVLFPGLKTRRLGVRGESKYHYVNFTLREDQVEELDALHHILPIPLPEASTSMDPNLRYVQTFEAPREDVPRLAHQLTAA